MARNEKLGHLYPIESMYDIYTYIWLILMVNVGKYTSPMDPMGMLQNGYTNCHFCWG